jgi:hypothetical protein
MHFILCHYTTISKRGCKSSSRIPSSIEKDEAAVVAEYRNDFIQSDLSCNTIIITRFTFSSANASLVPFAWGIESTSHLGRQHDQVPCDECPTLAQWMNNDPHSH